MKTVDEEPGGDAGPDGSPGDTVLLVPVDQPDEPVADTVEPPDERAGPPVPTATPDLGPEMLAALLPYLQEAVMVVREDWEVVANLAPGRHQRPAPPSRNARDEPPPPR